MRRFYFGVALLCFGVIVSFSFLTGSWGGGRADCKRQLKSQSGGVIKEQPFSAGQVIYKKEVQKKSSEKSALISVIYLGIENRNIKLKYLRENTYQDVSSDIILAIDEKKQAIFNVEGVQYGFWSDSKLTFQGKIMRDGFCQTDDDELLIKIIDDQNRIVVERRK